MTTQQSPADQAAPFVPDPQRWKILSVLLVAIFMSLVGVSIVNVAVPSIQTGLGASDSDVQWVLSGYALTFGVVLVAAGRAGDLLGRGGIFVIGIALFTLASIAAGLAPDAFWLNGARFVQGVASGLINPQGVGMIQQYFRGPERARAFGWFGTVVGVAVGVGPVIGGLLIGAGGPEIGWRLTFLVNVPVGILCLALALKWFPRPLLRRPATAADAPAVGVWRSLDPVGSLLLGLAVLATMLPFVEGGSSPWYWLTLPTGAVLAWLWVRWERHHRDSGRSPMVDLQIFAIPSFTRGTVIAMLYFLGMTSIWVLVALYFQFGHDRSALQAALVGLPAALTAAVASNWAGKRVVTHGHRVVVGGLATALVGLVSSIGVVLLADSGVVSEWWLLATLVFVGAAQGSVISPNQTLALAEVPLAYAGSSGAVMQTGQRIGTSVGIAVITSVAFAALGASGSWSTAMVTALALISVVIVVALAFAMKDGRNRA